jgi:hypothetical protein
VSPYFPIRCWRCHCQLIPFSLWSSRPLPFAVVIIIAKCNVRWSLWRGSWARPLPSYLLSPTLIALSTPWTGRVCVWRWHTYFSGVVSVLGWLPSKLIKTCKCIPCTTSITALYNVIQKWV